MIKRGVLVAVAILVPCLTAQPAAEPPVPIWRSGIDAETQYPQQYVFLSPSLEEIIIRFPAELRKSDARVPEVLRAKLRNNLKPALQASVSVESGGRYLYSYGLRNEPTATDPIAVWAIVAPDGVGRPPIHRGRWLGPSLSRGAAIAKQLLLPGAPPGRFMHWFFNSDSGGKAIRPGEFEDGFRILSQQRPGYTTAYFKDSPNVEWPKTSFAWPDSVVTQCQPVLRWEWLGKYLLTIGPCFRTDEKAGVVAQNLLHGLEQLVLITEAVPETPFIVEARERLTVIADSGNAAGHPFRTTPSSAREEELAQLVRLALDIEIPAPTGR